MSTVLPSASFHFCVYFSVVVGSPYRLAGLTLRDAELMNLRVVCPSHQIVEGYTKIVC